MKKQVKKIAAKALKGGAYEKVVLPKHYGVALATNVAKGFPARGLKVIGVTGTNGKTSTCYLIHKMLVEAGYNTGLMTTVAYGLNNDIASQEAHMTSQPIGMLMGRIEEMKSQGMDVLVLEVTSHALVQFRIMGVPIDIAVMTNITHDHLDYHGTFQAYLDAKVKLFKLAAKNKSGQQLGILNADDDNAAVFADAVPNVLAYSLKRNAGPGVAKPLDLKLTPKGSKYRLKIGEDEYKISCKLPGRFNVSNSMAAALVGRALGLNRKQIEAGIAALDGVDGRMTRVDEGQNFDVIVDFAHNPDALEKVLVTLKEVTPGRVAVVFGCVGGRLRDKTKRLPTGQVAGKHADLIYLTDDETYEEDPATIRDDTYKGIKLAKAEHKTEVIPDRKEAIKRAFDQAKKGDVVLLAGLGHQPYREMQEGQVPWVEAEIASDLLKKMKK